MFDIQDEIAKAIVGALKVKLFGDADAALVKRGTDNIEAYHLCLKAAERFQQALDIDPQYPPAIFGLADSHGASAGVDVEPDPAVCASMFEKAIRLDPEFAEAHAILGICQALWLWRSSEGQQRIETAMRMDPRHPHIFQVYSLCLAMQNRFASTCAAGGTMTPSHRLKPRSIWSRISGGRAWGVA